MLTLLHEQTTASSGIARTPCPAPVEVRDAGRISSSGLSGSAMPLPTMGRSTPYADASPTRIPPSSLVASDETTSFL